MKHRIRLALITQYWPFPTAPFGGRTAREILPLLLDRADIRVFCPVPVYPKFLRPTRYSYQPPASDYSPLGIPTQYVSYPALPALSRASNGAVSARRIFPLVRDFSPDLILNYWIYPEGYAAVYAGRRLGVPVVLCAIGSDLKRIPGPVTRYLTRRTACSADLVLAVSEDLRREAVALGVAPAKTATVLNGCDTTVFAPRDRSAARSALGVPVSARLVLFVGWMDASKGVPELHAAITQLKASYPQLRAVLVGEGPLRAQLEGSPHLIFTGAIDSGAVAQWMAAADIFCLPSHSEGCPNVVVEALACGRPVVGTSVGGIPELVDDNCGILTPPCDSVALAAALDRALTRQWDEAAIAGSHRRDWRMAAEELWKLCAALLERPAGSRGDAPIDRR